MNASDDPQDTPDPQDNTDPQDNAEPNRKSSGGASASSKAKPDFAGRAVASLESRRADDMRRMIEKFGGVPHVSPSMREVPIDPNHEAIDFAHAVMTGEISVVVLMTGVGFRYLIKSIEKHVDLRRFLDSLSDITTVCRGPKPVAAMREYHLRPTHRVPEPNTWRELLQTIDASVPVANQVVGLQEYGVTNASLVAGLEARGAIVRPLRVYGWDYPEQTDPLSRNVDRLCAGEIDVIMLTSAHQAVNLFRMAETKHRADQLRDALGRIVVASIGPTTTSMLEEMDIRVDFEPSHPKMGHLVSETAAQSDELCARRSRLNVLSPVPKGRDATAADDSLFMRAVRGQSTPRTPVWLMRQAGRYMHQYREVREQTDFLSLCQNPSLCAEVMTTAVEVLGVDAAIIFSDLLPILMPMGFDLKYHKGDGPKIHNPIRDAASVADVKPLDAPEQLDYVYETVRQTRASIDDTIPIIGFAGSPFTLASYAIEGGGSKTYLHTKRMMLSQPDAWQALMERLSEAIIVYLNHQIAAGADCVQLFDSWAGCLSPTAYARHVLPHMKTILASIAPNVPVINFATGNPELLPLLRGDRRTVVGVDWRIDLSTAWNRIGHDKCVQGNLDPAILLTDPETIRDAVADVLSSADGRDGHVFNLGHGVMKETPVENAQACVQAVQSLSMRS